MKDSTKAQDTGTAWSRAVRRGILVTLAIVAGAFSLGLAQPVQADNNELYATSFEQPIFPLGAQLIGLDGWVAATPPTFLPPNTVVLNPEAAIITGAAASNRKQSVEVYGGDLEISPNDREGKPFTSPYDAVGSYRRPFGPVGPDGVVLGYTLIKPKFLARVDAHLQLETKQPKTRTGDEFFSLTIAARSGDGKTLGEIGLSSEGIVEAFPFNSPPGDITKRFTKRIRFNKWYHITMLLDFDNRTTAYFIDEDFLGAVPQLNKLEDEHFLPTASDILLRGAMVVYARPDGDGKLRSDYTARFDNFRVSVHSAAPDIDD